MYPFFKIFKKLKSFKDNKNKQAIKKKYYLQY